jgi:hypothetical protein
VVGVFLAGAFLESWSGVRKQRWFFEFLEKVIAGLLALEDLGGSGLTAALAVFCGVGTGGSAGAGSGRSGGGGFVGGCVGSFVGSFFVSGRRPEEQVGSMVVTVIAIVIELEE